MDKRALRATMRARRSAFVRSLDAAQRAALLDDLQRRLMDLLPEGGIVASYSAVGDEIDPAGIAGALGRRLALPYFATRDDPMTFRLAGTTLERGPFDIPQPTADAAPVEPDILLVPLVAADDDGNRIGQGKGHYDRALAALVQRKPVLTIGVAWDVQIVERVEPDRWDVPLDRVVTPSRILG